jgi:hypothetical protein
MAGKKQILLTAEDVKTWLKEQHDLRQKIGRLQKELENVNQKLSAAELLSPGALDRKISAGAANGHAGQSNEYHQSGKENDIRDALCADMQASGASLKIGDIRRRLVELGFDQKIKESAPNYIYGLVGRLVTTQRLLKRGMKYRAAPSSSSQEETGADGSGPVV